MDRRRFFINKSLNEGLSVDQKKNLLEDVFADLDRLYEDTEEPAAENEVAPTKNMDNKQEAETVLDELKDA